MIRPSRGREFSIGNTNVYIKTGLGERRSKLYAEGQSIQTHYGKGAQVGEARSLRQKRMANPSSYSARQSSLSLSKLDNGESTGMSTHFT